MQKYSNVVQDTAGNALSGVSVQVNLQNTGASATIYSDNGVTTATNPLTTASDGSFKFYAANARYALVFSLAGYTFTASETSDLILFDPSDSVDINTTSQTVLNLGNAQATVITAVPAQITAGSGTGYTLNSAGSLAQHIYKATTTYAAFSASAKTASLTLATLPAKTRLVAVYCDVTVVFTGGGETAATLQLGKTVGGTEYLTPFDVFNKRNIPVGLNNNDVGFLLQPTQRVQGADIPAWSGTTVLTAKLITTTNNTSTLTGGTAVWYLITERLP